VNRAVWIAVLLSACDPMVSMDAGAHDAPRDAGCTGIPGELIGERRIAAGAGLPDLMLETDEGPVALTRYHTPCESRIIVIRSLTAWSGHSQWHAAHSAVILAEPRVDLIDLLTEDIDALPATAGDLSAWRARYDVPPSAIAIDPEARFDVLAFGGVRLPVVALVDARDLSIRRVLFAPRAEETEYEIQAVLAAMDGRPIPPLGLPSLIDGRFTADQWALIEGMRWAPPGADVSNAVADDAVAAGVGATFFEDAGLSPDGVGCTSCHSAELAFTDGLAVGHGVADVLRNTPTLLGAAHQRWMFWDGRADSLWAQALGPIESPLEMRSSRLYVAHRIAAVHERSYEAVFGALPDLSDAARFPPEGGPGDAAYDEMSEGDRALIDGIFADLGKAIAAYERTLRPSETPFDSYVGGELEALSPEARDGLLRFMETGCAQCHYGPTLSDGAFHAIAMPGSVEGDRGRIDALTPLRDSVFRRDGAYSDDPTATFPLGDLEALPPRTLGAFRTPPLRALVLTAPYGHGGTFATLADVVDHYAEVHTTTLIDPRVEGALDPHLPGFHVTDAERAAMVAFLSAL
jgi:cytochrome c peroxidase